VHSDDRPMSRSEKLWFAGALCLIAITATAADAGCDFRPPPTPMVMTTRVDEAQTAAAVFKMTEKVRVRAVNPAQGEEPDDTRDWTGTAWIIGHDTIADQNTYLMTAGHMCEDRKQIVETDDMFGVSESFDVLGVDYTVISSDDYVSVARPVLIDHDVDLCVVKVMDDLGPPLPIASADPDYAERGWYVGAPKGIWGGGLAPFVEVAFNGRAAPFKGQCEDDMVAACAHEGMLFSSYGAIGGASGSPVLVEGQVVGLLNMSAPPFRPIFSAVPWEVIRRTFDRALAIEARR
jgi:Trypsin-like peptidase domain